LYLFLECWDGEPDNRPTIYQVVAQLKAIIIKTELITGNLQSKKELNSNNDESSLNAKNSSQGEPSTYPNFDKMNTKNTKESVSITDNDIK
jgi:hypothetical protein